MKKNMLTLDEEIKRINSLAVSLNENKIITEQGWRALGKFADNVIKAARNSGEIIKPLNKIVYPLDVLDYFSNNKKLWKLVNDAYDVNKIEIIIDDIINGRKNPFTDDINGSPGYLSIPTEGNLRYNVIEAWVVKNKIPDEQLSKYISNATDKANLPKQKYPVLGSKLDSAKPKGIDIPTKLKINLGNFVRLYINNIKTIKDTFKPGTIESATKKFDELCQMAILDYLRGGKNIDSYKATLNNAFFEMGRVFSKDKTLYEQSWKIFKKNVLDQFVDGDSKRSVAKFLDELYQYNGENSLISIKEAIESLSKDKNQSTFLFDKVKNALRDILKPSFGKEIKLTFKTVFLRILKLLFNQVSFGSFRKPKDVISHFIKMGYSRKQMTAALVGRYLAKLFIAPLLPSLVEMAFDGGLNMIYNKLEEDNPFRQVIYKMVGSEARGNVGFSDYYRKYLTRGISEISEGLNSDSLLAGVNILIPGFIDNFVVYGLSLATKGYTKLSSSVEKGIYKPKENTNKEKIIYIEDISSPESISLSNDSLLNWSGLDLLTKKLNGKKELEGIKNLKDYFRFPNKNETKYYFFLKNDTQKKLTINLQTLKNDRGIETDVILTGTDENETEYSQNDMLIFTKKLIKLVNNKEILSIDEYNEMKYPKITKLKEKVINKNTNTETKVNESINIKNTSKKIISEMSEGKKFGEDNFKHWKDTFKFKKHDEKTNQLKDVKITAKMDEIMDRIDHFRKKYDEDDSFVRAVIDVYGTGIDIIQYTKGLAHLTEGVQPQGLLSVLSLIRESKELVTWSVKHYKDGNWELVKGNFNKKELLNVGKTKRERDERQKELENPAEGLKKKELESIMVLKRDEKEGINGLPTKVKEKIKEKLRQGWTTETPFEFLSQFYTESEINSVFNEKIKIYKLKPSLEFFRTLAKNSAKINLKKGFCKSLKTTKVNYEMSQRENNVLQNFILKCETKFGV